MGFGRLAGALDGWCLASFNRFQGLSRISQAWSRAQVEWIVEWPLLKKRWRTIVLCLVFQYVHGIFTQLVYRLHEPQNAPLKDLGFHALPELGPKWFWVSELLFAFLFISFALWVISPFFLESKSFYTFVLLKRLLVHLVCCQSLRIVSFMVTVLPGPAHHCRASQATSQKPWVRHWWEHIIVDVAKQSSKSCGDLVFSSHTTFILSFVLCYTYYGKTRINKIIAWVLAVILSVLIVASRKHYTVDVVVAWYTVPLVFLALERRWTTTRIDLQTERSMESPAHLAMMESVVVIPPSASLSEGLDRLALMNNGDSTPPEMSQRKPGKPMSNGSLPYHSPDNRKPPASETSGYHPFQRDSSQSSLPVVSRDGNGRHSRSVSIDGFINAFNRPK